MLYRPTASSRRGNALFPGLILISVVSITMAGYLSSAVENSQVAVDRVDRFEIKRAVSSVNRMVAQDIWSNYKRTLVIGETPSTDGMRTHLTAAGLGDMTGLVPTRLDMLNQVGLPVNAAGDIVFGDSTILSISVHREDDGSSTSLFVTSVAQTDLGPEPLIETQTDVFALEPPPWDGLDFALLANNVNCIMCHTTVDDAKRVYGDGSGRARVGSIESFQIREDPDSVIAGTLYLGGDAIDGDHNSISDWSTLSLVGAQLDGDGKVIQDVFGTVATATLTENDPMNPSPNANLYTNYLDNLDDQVAGSMPDSFPRPFKDDGGVDSATGDPVATGADNRSIDDTEFYATTSSFSGSLTGGKIGVSPTGDVIGTSGSAALLADGNATDLAAVTDGNVILTGTDFDPIRIDGDVAIDGDLIISGPLVGSGSLWVRGNIYVRGDLEYQDAVSGSERQFGLGTNGQANSLGLVAGGNVVVGDPYRPQWGNGAAADGTSSGSWNFTLEMAAQFNGREWLKTQAELPGEPISVLVRTDQVQQEQFQTNTRTESQPVYAWREDGGTWEEPIYAQVQTGTTTEPVYETVFHPSTLTPPYDNSYSETVQTGTQEVPVYEQQQTGTQTVPTMEQYIDRYEDVEITEQVPFDPPQFATVDVPVYETQTPMITNPDFKGADYIARYYEFGPGDPVPIQTGEGYYDVDKGAWAASERVDGWGSSELTLADPNDPNDPFLFPASSPAAVLSSLEPATSWMDADVLRGLITDSLEARDETESLKVDATLYSSNSIFGVVPDSASEGTNGELRVQGAVLAADVGLLSPTGTEIIYDERGANQLDVRDESKMKLSFVGTLPAPLP